MDASKVGEIIREKTKRYKAIYMFFLNGEAVNEDDFYAQSHIFDWRVIGVFQ